MHLVCSIAARGAGGQRRRGAEEFLILDFGLNNLKSRIANPKLNQQGGENNS